MAMYAIALTPLVTKAKSLARQVWFADDATGCDKAEILRKWYDLLIKEGPSYGYFPQPEKCILIAKEGKDQQLTDAFRDTQVKITTIGARHLGAVLGSPAFKRDYITEKVKGWIEALTTLAKFAQTQPHAAFAVFTHCLQGCWTFLCRTVPGAGFFLQALEDCIRGVFIPALLNAMSQTMSVIYSLFQPSSVAWEFSIRLKEPCLPSLTLKPSAFP